VPPSNVPGRLPREEQRPADQDHERDGRSGAAEEVGGSPEDEPGVQRGAEPVRVEPFPEQPPEGEAGDVEADGDVADDRDPDLPEPENPRRHRQAGQPDDRTADQPTTVPLGRRLAHTPH
jgi:hypothetical protein